jgi:hypothetical protein
MGPPRRRTESIAAAGLLLAAQAAQGQAAPFPTAGVKIEIAVAPDGGARIHESYALAPGTTVPGFQYLSGPCATVDGVTFSLGDAPVHIAPLARGPWRELHPDAATRATGGGAFLTVSYQVRLTGRWTSIPVVMPMAPLATGAGRTASAEIALRLPQGPPAGPVLPRLTASGGGTWTGAFNAIPSVVVLDRGAPQPPCAEPAQPGDAGSFGVRFTIFLATLLLWIPLYFWWANRQDRGT